MSWSAPRTWVAGETVSAAIMNTHVRDNFKAGGDWTAVTFAAGNFAAQTGSWTVASGNVVYNKYQRVGSRLKWHVTIQNSTTTAPTSGVLLTIPPAMSLATSNQWGPIAHMYDGAVRTGYAQGGNATQLLIVADGGLISASAVFFVAFQIEMEVF